MSDALQRRLDRITRRQRYLLLLLVYPPLVVATWLAIEGIDPQTAFAVVLPALVLGVVAYLLALSRSRGSPDGETDAAPE